MSAEIPVSEVAFHPASYVDPDVQVFLWRDGLYRGIAGGKAANYRSVLGSAGVNRMMQARKLVNTQATDDKLAPFALVLKHERLPVVSYVHEWCFDAIKDAALLVLDLQEELAGDGVELADPHPWNVLFDGAAPIFVDFGAIVPLRPGWSPCLPSPYYVNPLRLFASGHGRVARALLCHADQRGVEDDEAVRILNPGASRAKAIARKLLSEPLRRSVGQIRKSERQSPAEFFASARAGIAGLALPLQANDRTDEVWRPTPDSLRAARQPLAKVLTDLQGCSLVEVGISDGWCALEAARSGARVIAFGTDEAAVNRLYVTARDEKLDLQPLVMCVASPSGGAGDYAREYPPGTERFRCETAIALDIVPELVHRNLPFERIAEALSDFAERRLVVAFFAKDDLPAQWWQSCEWYTLDRLKRALAGKFTRILECPAPAGSPVLLVCEK
jgi:hypothetical protein